MMSMNSAYVDDLYYDFLRDPDSVSPEWRAFFATYTPERALEPTSVTVRPLSPVPDWR